MIGDQSPPSPHDFSGRYDLFGFINAADKFGLKVILRLGPYVCAEVSYGGFPARLRDVPGIQFRTWNSPFMGEVEKWIRYITNELKDRKLFASSSGPVILVQLENEYSMISSAYGNDGAQYLQWMADLQRELNLGIPSIMCYGAAKGVVETINSFYAHKDIQEVQERHPDQPSVWTECWTGWYDTWGAPHHVRSTEDLAYAVARFFAVGGAGVNYYMWMGGTNWGREGMYLQKTSYDYDAPIDEFYRHTAKSKHLAALHEVVLHHIAPDIAAATRREYECGGAQVIEWSCGVSFYCNDSNKEVTLIADGIPENTILRPLSVQIRTNTTQKLLFDTSTLPDIKITSSSIPAIATNADAWKWETAREPIPTVKNVEKLAEDSKGIRVIRTGDKRPPQLLAMTRDASDYCFYLAEYEVPECSDEGEEMSFAFEAGDYAHVFIDGEFAGRTDAEAPWEDRFTNKWTKHAVGNEPGMRHVITSRNKNAAGSRVCVTLLVASLGLVKGDWQLGSEGRMEEERKGLLSDVDINGKGASWRRTSPWTCLPMTTGECTGFPACTSTSGTQISSYEGIPGWHRTKVVVPRAKSWTLDLGGMGKGLFWVNGILLGRYWNIAGIRDKVAFLDGSLVQQVGHGEKCQRYYHVPEWVCADGDGRSDEVELNILLFDEFGRIPDNERDLLNVVVPI